MLMNLKNVREYVCQNNITDHYCTILKLNKTLVNNRGEFNNKLKDFTDINKLEKNLNNEAW